MPLRMTRVGMSNGIAVLIILVLLALLPLTYWLGLNAGSTAIKEAPVNNQETTPVQQTDRNVLQPDRQEPLQIANDTFRASLRVTELTNTTLTGTVLHNTNILLPDNHRLREANTSRFTGYLLSHINVTKVTLISDKKDIQQLREFAQRVKRNNGIPEGSTPPSPIASQTQTSRDRIAEDAIVVAELAEIQNRQRQYVVRSIAKIANPAIALP